MYFEPLTRMQIDIERMPNQITVVMVVVHCVHYRTPSCPPPFPRLHFFHFTHQLHRCTHARLLVYPLCFLDCRFIQLMEYQSWVKSTMESHDVKKEKHFESDQKNYYCHGWRTAHSNEMKRNSSNLHANLKQINRNTVHTAHTWCTQSRAHILRKRERAWKTKVKAGMGKSKGWT